MGKAFGIRARPEPAPQLLAASTAEPLAECLLTMLAVETPRERDWLGVFSLTGAVSSLARTSGPRLSDESVLHIEIRGCSRLVANHSYSCYAGASVLRAEYCAALIVAGPGAQARWA